MHDDTRPYQPPPFDPLGGPEDFLGAPDPARARALELLDIHHGEIAAWAARALVNRCPEAALYRGLKGVRACEHELGRHMRRLRDSVSAGEPEELHAYAGWVRAVFRRRRVPVSHLERSVELLAEALARHLPWPHGEALGERVIEAFDAH